MEFSPDSYICIINYLLQGLRDGEAKGASDIWVVTCYQICAVMQTLCVVISGYDASEQNRELYFSTSRCAFSYCNLCILKFLPLYALTDLTAVFVRLRQRHSCCGFLPSKKMHLMDLLLTRYFLIPLKHKCL